MKLLRQLRSLFRKGKLDAEMAEEMQAHVDLQTELNRKAGMEPDEARYAALRQFGNVAVIQEQAREVRSWVWFEQLLQDTRFAFRQLARSKGFTVIVVLTLALGIGATTAIYSVINTVILNPVGGPEPDRLVQITERQVLQGMELMQGVSPPVLEALFAHRDQFTDLAWSDWCQLERKAEDFSKIEYGAFVSPNFFAVLGVKPLLGRDFLPSEAVPFVDGLPAVDASMIISYAWWQSDWGGDPKIIGHIIEMSGRHFTVVGVMPPHVRFPNSTTPYWVPGKPVAAPSEGARAPITMVVGRLKPEGKLPYLKVVLDTMAKRLMTDYPENSAYGGIWRMNPQGLQIVGRNLSAAFQGTADWTQLRQTLLGLMSAIGFVLLIVCANVANLTLARVERRQHELAIRVATGASRGRLMRQLLTENLILALLGGGAGLGVTAWGLKLLMAMNAMPRLRPVQIDGPLLAVALVLSTLTGIAFGLAPMWRGGRVQVNLLLADGGMNATGGRRRSYFRNALVVAQLAITVVLLTGAGLMLQSVNRLLRVNPGFDPQNLLLLDMPLPSRKYDEPKNADELKILLYAQLRERFGALPGVKAVGFQVIDAFFGCQVEGKKEIFFATHAQVSIGASDFFQAMRAPLVAGRYFMPEDSSQKQYVVVNEALARQFWPGETALGKKFHLADSASVDDAFQVIGVVGDAKVNGYTEDMKPTIYHSFQAMWTRTRILGGMPPQVVIRTDNDPEIIISLVRRELKSAEPDLLMPRFRMARQVLFDSTLPQRTYRNYLGFFAGLGLLLSALGIYGVLAYSVARRTREIGIRLAIGAEETQVRAMILRQGAWLIAGGIGTGLLASFGLSRFLQSQLYQVSPHDPGVIGGVLVVLSLVALAACWLPARRAAKVDPVIALRAE